MFYKYPKPIQLIKHVLNASRIPPLWRNPNENHLLVGLYMPLYIGEEKLKKAILSLTAMEGIEIEIKAFCWILRPGNTPR